MSFPFIQSFIHITNNRVCVVPASYVLGGEANNDLHTETIVSLM